VTVRVSRLADLKTSPFLLWGRWLSYPKSWSGTDLLLWRINVVAYPGAVNAFLHHRYLPLYVRIRPTKMSCLPPACLLVLAEVISSTLKI
jgi:hypothetical protein